MAGTKTSASNETVELRRRAQKVNALLKSFAKSSKDASKVVGALNGIASELDGELSKFITMLEGVADSEEGVTSLRSLKASNGLNLRMTSGMNSYIGRLHDTQKKCVIVS